MADPQARFVTGLAAAAIGLSILWTAAASAAPAMTSVRLGLTGMATSHRITGSSMVRSHAGATLGFLAGSVPGLDELHLGDVLNLRVTMDASALPGGSRARVLNDKTPYRITLRKAGIYTVHWTVGFVLDLGKRTHVAATRQLSGNIVVAGATGSGGSVSATHASTPALVAPTPSTAARATAPPPSLTSGPTTPPSTPQPSTTAHHGGPPPHALPPMAPADTYVFTAFVGIFVLGVLWLLWVASIKPILGR